MIDLTVNLASILQGLTVAGIVGLFKVLMQVRDHLGKLNGRIAKAEQWQDLHSSQCDERYHGLKEEHRSIWTVIRGESNH
jgi:hypothetical protein